MEPGQATAMFAHRLEDRAKEYVHSSDADRTQAGDKLFNAYDQIMKTHPGIADALQTQIRADRSADPLVPEIDVHEDHLMVRGAPGDRDAKQVLLRSR